MDKDETSNSEYGLLSRISSLKELPVDCFGLAPFIPVENPLLAAALAYQQALVRIHQICSDDEHSCSQLVRSRDSALEALKRGRSFFK